MISPADWQRMSWHARERYMRRHRVRPVLPEPEKVIAVVTPRTIKNEGIVHRCNECGAWMIDVCNTEHGNRYEP